MELVGDHGLAGEDGAGAGELAAVGGQAYEGEDEDEDGELEGVGGAGVGEELPEEHQNGLGDGHGPDGAVEVAALGSLAEGGAADAGEFAEGSEEKDQVAEGRVGVVVDLLQVPAAGRDGDEEAGEVEQGEAEDGVPGEGVADAAVEGVGLVFVEAENVGAGFGSGKAAAEGGDAGGEENEGEPEEVAAVQAVGEEAEGERTGGEEEDPDPDGPVCETVESSVAFADLPLLSVFNLAAVLHMGESRRGGEGASISHCLPLRVGRSLRDGYTPSAGASVGRGLDYLQYALGVGA